MMDKAESVFNAGAADYLESVLERLNSEYEEAAARCDSEIEKIMLAALMFMNSGWHDSAPTAVRVGRRGQGVQVVIYPQKEVGSYRVDFAVHAEFGDMLPTVKVAVECDGHEFHEKTKEQAARDKARDRVLATSGYTVLRFTGSEIYRDAPACAEQVASVIFETISAAVELHCRRGAQP